MIYILSWIIVIAIPILLAFVWPLWLILKDLKENSKEDGLKDLKENSKEDGLKNVLIDFIKIIGEFVLILTISIIYLFALSQIVKAT